MSRREGDVQPLLPATYGRVEYARGVRAGRWVFATGQMAQDETGAIADDVVRAHNPQRGLPKHTREAQRIYDRVAQTLHAGGTHLSNAVRVDQYYRTHLAVDPYHLVRHERFAHAVPPSTSIVMDDLLLPEADIQLELMAIVPEDDFVVRAAHDDSLDGPAESGFPMGLKAGDYVFLSGNVPSPRGDDPAIDGVAVKARMREGTLWWGQPIHLETSYVVGERLAPALERVGSSLDDVVKAQIYLTHHDEVAAFNQAWSRFFPKNPPATTIAPCPPGRLGIPAARVEINVLSVTSDGATPKQVVDTGVFPAFDNQSVAIRAGDLLLVSGLMAVDEGGLAAAARIDPRRARFGACAEAQAEHILANAERICEAAGTSLANVVRIQQFHTDLDEFYEVHRVWQRLLPGRPLPYSAVGVPGPLPVPGATVMMDLWFYAP